MEFKNIFLVNGIDKKNIHEFADKIDILVVNANIALHNKKMITNTAENYNKKIIIDPMTYMLQAGPKILLKDGKIKPSLNKVLTDIYGINTDDINFNDNLNIINYFKNEETIKTLCDKVYEFQKKYFENNDLGVFNTKEDRFAFYSLPYFDVSSTVFLDFNKEIIKYNLENNRLDLFRIIISEKTNLSLLPELIEQINFSNISIIEIWVESNHKKNFENILKIINKCKKEVLFKFVSFTEIVKIYKSQLKNNTKGFISAFGYGESRNVYPVGGGLPVNKVYSLFRRERINATDFFAEVEAKGIDIENNLDGEKYLELICSCSVCKKIINEYGLKRIDLFADFSEYNRKLANGLTSRRVMATQKAIVLTNYHYIDNKLKEYKDFQNKNDAFSESKYLDFFKYYYK